MSVLSSLLRTDGGGGGLDDGTKTLQSIGSKDTTELFYVALKEAVKTIVQNSDNGFMA